MMTDLNKVVKVALIALTMLVGAQGASADDVATVVENTKAPFGFATRSSRTEATAYNITGGGAYTVSDVKAMITKGGDLKNSQMTVDDKKIIVLTSDGETSMDATILSAITANDIIVFDGSDHTDFLVDVQITLSDLSNKTIIGLNGARLCTTWHITDVIKNWLNSVETSSGSGVSNASTASGTGGSITLKNVAGEDSITIAIDEEGEYLTRKTLAERGAAADPSTSDLAWEQYYFLRNERYRKSGIFYIQRCENVIIRNLSFVGPGSVDVGGVDLVSVINSSHHIWVDHCEFIDGQDGNFDITNESDYITASWCHFHYTDRSYVHQNTNLVGSSDSKVEDRGKLNITFAYNEWGENCRSRMPMARFGKIHLLNNWYNCSGNTENAVNPRLESEFLIEGNYFDKGIIKTFKNNGSTGVSISDNTVADPAGGSITASGTAVTVPYTYNKVPSTSVPEMIELLVGPLLDKEPTYTINPENKEGDELPDDEEIEAGVYKLKVSSTRAAQGLAFSVWADYAMSYQWYKATASDLSDAVAIDGATRNAYTLVESSESTTYLYCEATGLAGTTRSNIIMVVVSGTGAPIISPDLVSYETRAYEASKGVPFTLSIDAGDRPTYQWYHNTVPSYEGATAIDPAENASAATKSYTYTTPTGSAADVRDYFFCVASNSSEGEVLSTKSKIAAVKYVAMQTLINFVADTNVPDETDLSGLTISGAVYNSSPGTCNSQSLYGIRFGSSSNYIQVTPEGGFKTGDRLVVAGFINASDVAKKGQIKITDSEGASQIALSDTVINAYTHTAIDPVDYEYTFTSDAESVRLVRQGNTGLWVTKILVTRGDPDEPNMPYITTDIDETYETTAGTAVDITMVAEDADSYAWYTVSGTGSYETGKTEITGETDATCSFSKSDAGTYYVYGVAISGTGEVHKRDTTRIATVTVKKGSGTVKKTFTWDMKDWQSLTKTNGEGVSQDFGATEDSEQRMYYFGDIRNSDTNGTGSDAHAFTGFTSTNYIRTAGASTIASAATLKRVFKYHAPGKGQITVYGKGVNKDSARKVYVNNALSTTGASEASMGDGSGSVYFEVTYDIAAESDIYIWDNTGEMMIHGIVAQIEVAKPATTEITREWIFTKEAGWGAQSVTAGSSKTVNELTAVGEINIDANSKTLDGKSFSMRAKFKGTGSSEACCLKFDVVGPTVIDVWAMSGKNDATTRPLYYKFGSAEAVKFTDGDLGGASLQKVTAEYTGTAPTTVYIYSGNSGINVYGIKAVTTIEDDGSPNCKKPTAKKGDYVPANEAYTYTIKTTTATGYLKYTIGDGEEQTFSGNSTNIEVPCGASVTVQAYDNAGQKEDSEILTFTGDDMPKTGTPTIAVGAYSFSTHAFPVTMTADAGATIHYTTDGTDPTEASTTYSSAIDVNPEITIKAIAIQTHYNNSSVATSATPAFAHPEGDEKIIRDNGASGENKGISYTVDATYNSGTYSGNSGTGIKYKTNAAVGPTGSDKGFRIYVNDNFIIKKLVFTNFSSNYASTETFNHVYVDGSTTDIRDVNGEAYEDIVPPFYNATEGEKSMTWTLDNLNARDSVVFHVTPGGNQVRALVEVYYEVDDSPVSVSINGGEAITVNDTNFPGTATTKTYADATVYNEAPTIVMTTSKGFQYNLAYTGSEADGDKRSIYSYSLRGVTYEVRAKVKAVAAPLINIASELTMVTPDADHITSSATMNGGYEVTLTDIKEEEGVVPYIIIDGGSPQVYDKDKHYYALSTVRTYCTYNDEGTPAQTGNRDAACPDNSYSASKPFAAFLYQEGFADGGAGQGKAESANSYDPTLDQVHLGLADKFNVIDYHFSSADATTYTVTEKFPGIQNAKLVVLSEMISGSGSYVDAEGTNTNSTKMVMSFRDELIGHTNVLNMKMFFYSQSQNNYQRWSWAQPAALNNTVLSIKPANTLYKVFENVSLSVDGSIALFKPIDDENTLNHFQMVHNFNEENEALPNFVRLASATDTDGEEFEALHYFEKNGFTYVGTGISINDYLNYDENLRELVSTIGQMIIDGTSLGTVMDYVPAPRIRDNGNGSATISNNNPTATTYYRTSDSADETWTAEQIKAGGAVTKDGLTTKSSTDVWVYAISDVSGSLSAIAKAEVKGSPYRYVHRTTDDAEAQGKTASVRFLAATGSVTIPYNQSFSKPGYTVTSWKDKYSETVYTPGQVVATTQDIYLVAQWTKNTKKITDTNAAQTEAQRTVTWNFLQGDGAPAMKLENGSTTVGQKGILVGQMIFSNTPGDFIDVPMTINADGTASLPDTGETYTGKFDNTTTSFSDVNNDKYLSDFAQVRTGTTFTFPAVYGMQVKYKQATFEKYDDKANNVREKSQSYVSQSELTGGTLTNPGLDLNGETGAVALTDGVSTINATYGAGNLANGGVFNYTSATDTIATLTSKESARYMAPEAPATTTKTVGALNYGSVFMESLSVVYPALYDLSVNVDFHEGHVNILPNKLELTEEQIKARAAKVTLTEANKNCDGRYNAGSRLNIKVVPDYSFYFQYADASEDITFTSASGETAPEISVSPDRKTATGQFTIQPNTVVNILLKQNTVHAYKTSVTPLSTGTLRIDSQTGKSAEDEYTMFPNDSTITITPTPKIGYRFDRWTNAEGTAYGVGTWPTGVTCDANGKLTIVVNNDNAENDYVAVFEEGKRGTVNYRLPWAGLYIDETHYETFGTTLAPGEPIDIPQAKQSKYLYTQQYPNYRFPVSRTTTALYIPTSYTLYKEGYTLKNWAHIEDFDPEDPEVMYNSGVTEYNIGTYYYFNSENDTRDIIPIFKANPESFDYRTTTADITWDFRTAYMAQRLYFDDPTSEFDYATHTTINGDQVIDVPLHIKGTADNTALDEWCHFDQGTVITIPSGLGAKFTFVTYHKLSSTTIDGEVPLEYTMRTENDIPVYYYTYTTHSTKTSIDLVIGKDHTYFKYIRGQLPAADAVKLTTTTNNPVWGSNEVAKVSTTEEKILDDSEESDVEYTADGNVYTLPLGSYVKVKATRERLYELKAFVVDGDTISVITDEDLEAAEAKGYTITKPADDSSEKVYTLKFRMQTYATEVEAVYGDRQKWQVTYSPGTQAAGEAPGVAVVENGEAFTMPAKNQTLYLEGYTLKYWKDENGRNAVKADGTPTGENKYEWGKEYLPSADLYLTPVFEINDFTLFDIPSTGATVEWPLATGKDIVKYGNAPLLKYQKSSGVYVSQLTLADGRYIDLDLKIDCSESGAKVDNSAADYRCQINAASKITVPTNKKTTISVVTANGQMSTTKIAGAIGSKGGTNSTSYGSGSKDNTEGAGTNDYSYSVNYTGDESSQNIEFMGDAGYFKMIKAEYGKVSNDGLPQLDYVTVNNIALGSFGTPYEAYTINALKNSDTHSMDIAMELSTTAAMPVVKAKADQNDAVVTVIQPTKEAPTATIIVKTASGATVSIYKLDFEIEYVSTTPPVLQRVEMNNLLVKARDVNGTMQTYLEEGTKLATNGAISLTFDHNMNPTQVAAANNGLGQDVSATTGKTLTFRYWNLDVDTEYTFTVPESALTDVYGTAYNGGDISFTFHTAATSMHIDKRNVDFVVTHKQTHVFNSTNPEQNYTSGIKRQVASDELIANLTKDGIAFGTIDEGLAMAHAAGGTDRFYIFVPDGEYQIKGNTPTAAITAASSSNGAAPADNSGALRDDLMGRQIYNGITTITRENLSITGQSEANTKLFNKPEIEGISYTSTFFVSGVTGFYVQDMTLTNAFDYKTSMANQGSNSAQAARGVVLRDRGVKTIMKNVTMDSWQDTYYSNGSNQYSDSRGYFEDCTIKGYVDFFCGDGDHWFERCNLILRNGKAGNASNMMAPRTYATQLWGYVFNNCEISAEDETTFNTCNNKFTLARPWSNSPAASFLYTKYNVLPSADGYKQMTAGGLVLRMHEYGSTDANGALVDLSTRSLRASSPGAGSYAPVMTPTEAAEYTVHNALGGTDGYDPTIYTAQVSMEGANLTSVDRSLSWDGQSEALCYFIFRKTDSGDDELFAITADTSYELDDAQIGRTFTVRAANQRGGLGEPSNEFTYEVHESYKLTLTTSQQAPIYNSSTGKDEDWSWSTVYLDYNAKAPVIDDGGTISDVYVYAVVDVTPISMTLKRVNILEKNQGYIVKGKPGTYTFAYTDSDGEYYDHTVAVAGSLAESENRMSILDGTVETVSRAGKEVYTLFYKANYGLGFYTYTGEYLNANKAYLNGSYVGTGGTGSIVISGSGNSTRGFIFLDDEATSINRIDSAADDDSEKIYTIYGQRVKRSEMIKGRVYIINGRKIAY